QVLPDTAATSCPPLITALVKRPKPAAIGTTCLPIRATRGRLRGLISTPATHRLATHHPLPLAPTLAATRLPLALTPPSATRLPLAVTGRATCHRLHHALTPLPATRLRLAPTRPRLRLALTPPPATRLRLAPTRLAPTRPPPRAYSPSPPPRANAGPRYPPESRGNAARYPPPLRAAPYARGEGGAVIHRRVKLEDQPGSSRSAALDERLALAPAAPRDRSSRTAALDQGAPAAPHAGSSRSAALDQRLALPVALPRPESSRSAALDQRAPPPHAGSSRDNRPQQGDRTAQTYPRLDLAERPPAPKRKHNDAGSLPTDRDAKRSRLQDDEALRPGQLDVYKLRFRVSSGVPKVFYATRFRRVGKWSRADMLLYYEFRHPDRGDVLVHIPKDSTPVFVSEQDRQRYESEISIHGLEDF
ncbi:hypothetical protein B0H11DRAFT_2267627, partial [Mycena galericulata]